MLLTIVTQGKNDDYCGNFKQRFENSINKLIDNIEKLNVIKDVEIIIVDWGSDEYSKLSESINIKKTEIVNFLYVPQNITNKFQGFSIPHTQNAGFRRGKGEYSLLLEGDSYIDIDSFKKLINFLKKKPTNIFYWGSRYHIPYDVHSKTSSFSELDMSIQNWIDDGKKLSKPFEFSWYHDKIDINRFVGGATALLVSKNVYEDCTGQYEILTKWGWSDVELHNRLLKIHSCNGDLEDLGVTFYTQLHHHDGYGGTVHGSNPHHTSDYIKANSNDWGLINYDLELYQKS
jgi:hypothetical protein